MYLCRFCVLLPQRYRDWGPGKRFSVGVTASLPNDFMAVCMQAGLTPDALEIQGGLTVDGQPAALDAGGY